LFLGSLGLEFFASVVLESKVCLTASDEPQGFDDDSDWFADGTVFEGSNVADAVDFFEGNGGGEFLVAGLSSNGFWTLYSESEFSSNGFCRWE